MTSRILVRAIAFIVAAVFLIGSWIETGSPSIGFLRLFSVAVFVVTVLLLVWDHWLWRTKLLQKIPSVPRNIRGTWKGKLESLWVDPKSGLSPAPKTVYVVIKQTSSEITVKLISDESVSESSVAKLKQENGSWVLHYIYTNESKMQLRRASPIHHGSGVYVVSGRPAKRLEGNYWTDRDSKGHLTLSEKVSCLADDFVEAEALFGQP